MPQCKSQSHTKHMPGLLGLVVAEAARLPLDAPWRIRKKAAVNDALMWKVILYDSIKSNCNSKGECELRKSE